MWDMVKDLIRYGLFYVFIVVPLGVGLFFLLIHL